MSQLISSNYSSSKEGNTLSAIYLNSMIYQVSPTYHWTFDLGYAGMPYNSFQNGWTGGQPIGSIGFLWTPKPNLLISAQFSKGVSYSQEFLYTPYKRSIIQNP
ncbi:MAG: hypothetical protein N2450_00145 [bacterium]|nr:hypothetical protein [bacterium]